MGGSLEYISWFLGGGHKHRKWKQLHVVELLVMMDCDGCEHKIYKALFSMRGVETVDINRMQQKVTVVGYVEPYKVLKKAKSTLKKVEIWPYVPYNFVSHPNYYATYDKNAPLAYMRNMEYVAVYSHNDQGGQQQDEITTMFSDDNPNACSIM